MLQLASTISEAGGQYRWLGSFVILVADDARNYSEQRLQLVSADHDPSWLTKLSMEAPEDVQLRRCRGDVYGPPPSFQFRLREENQHATP